MTGGAFRSSSNLLGRRREIDDLSRVLSKKKQALESLEKEVEQAHDRRNHLREEIAAVTGKIQQSSYDLGTLKLKMQDVDLRIQKTQDAFAQINAQREEIARQRESLKAQHDVSGDNLKQSDASQKALNDDIDSRTKELDALKRSAAEADTSLSRLQVQLAGSGQERTFITQNQERLREEIQARETERGGIEKTLRNQTASKADREGKIGSLKEQAQKEQEKEAQLKEELQQLTALREEKEKKQKTFFTEREQLAEHSSYLDREVFRLEQQIEKMKADREKDIAYLWEEYELTPVACRELRRDDLGSLTEMKKRIGELRHDIRQLGSVNVGAIEEYRELSQRFEFLSAQHEDLVKSAADLEKIIKDLDEGMRDRFKEQFSMIQTEFDRTFRDLFGGGKGTLELEEGVDILDAGIRVIAQPPGKKLQNMMQLSGGEKSLAAIALLFAIQNLKPSPFCLLDEIESALDENNVERYAQYLRKLTKHTQFIIITHRRGSMTAADRLYGITMQEKGISALVSVDLVADKLDA
jgi:chromosome segregation protein